MTGLGQEPAGATLLDPDELDGLKFKHVTTRGELDELEQSNVQSGLLWLSRTRVQAVLSETFICTLHKRLFGDVWKWAGAFRQTEKNIGVAPMQIAVQLHLLLDDARYWHENDTYRPLEAATRFHHRLVQIHCFPNGNGRHARIMADKYLQRCFDHTPIDWVAGHDLMKENKRRDEYIAALRSADQGDYAQLFRFVGSE